MFCIFLLSKINPSSLSRLRSIWTERDSWRFFIFNKNTSLKSLKNYQDSFPVCSTLLQLVKSVGCIRKGYELLDLIGKSTQVIFSRTREVAKGNYYRIRELTPSRFILALLDTWYYCFSTQFKGTWLVELNPQLTHALNYSLIILKLTNETTAILSLRLH